MSDENQIALSIVLRVVGGEAFVRRCLSYLVQQVGIRSIEIIVPYDETVGRIVHLAKEFTGVHFVSLGSIQTKAHPDTPAATHELCDRRTARGLSVARGEIVALLEDYATPQPDWCDQILKAHKLPHGVIGGAVEHNGEGVLNWAIYFLDFGRYQLPLQEGPADYLTDVNVSYKRSALESMRAVWEEEYNEVAVHWTLIEKGVVLWRRPQIVVCENRGKLVFARLLLERFSWGSLFASVRARQMALRERLLYVVLSPIIPVVLTWRLAKKVFNTRRNRDKFLLSSPFILLFSAIWCLGEGFGYITGRAYSQ